MIVRCEEPIGDMSKNSALGTARGGLGEGACDFRFHFFFIWVGLELGLPVGFSAEAFPVDA